MAARGSNTPEWLTTEPLPRIAAPGPPIPRYGYRVSMAHRYSEKCAAFSRPRLNQMVGFVGMAYRYARLWLKKYKQRKRMFIDNFNLCPWRPIYGAPIGGIGCGSIGRGFKGEFCRFQLIPGIYRYSVVESDQFIVSIRRKGVCVYQRVLSPISAPNSKSLRSWQWKFPADHATYQALYPRAWTVYDIAEEQIRLTYRQISPIIPHDYKVSSYPVAVFAWNIENYGTEECDVSVTFTFSVGQGHRKDITCATCRGRSLFGGPSVYRGVRLDHELQGMPVTYAISSVEKDNVDISTCTGFDADSVTDCERLWKSLKVNGDLSNEMHEDIQMKSSNSTLTAAVCARLKSIQPGQSTSNDPLTFVLCWHMPYVHFGDGKQKYERRYNKFGTIHCELDTPMSLITESFTHYYLWERRINEWQAPILNSSNLPTWYKSALFNELYYVADGGTLWLHPLNPASSSEYEPFCPDDMGKFAYLEGHEYRMYNTYDVHHYASFSLIILWPKLQVALQQDIANYISVEQKTPVKFCMSGAMGIRKSANCVPHDIGDPEEEPWLKVNAYVIHPTEEWKDLNVKFVLQVYRDYVFLLCSEQTTPLSSDETTPTSKYEATPTSKYEATATSKDEAMPRSQSTKFLEQMFPKVKIVMEQCLRWDTDHDGIIDNAGFADQTYDAWTMTGASAYCGGMWVAALRMYVAMCHKMRDLQANEDGSNEVVPSSSSGGEERYDSLIVEYTALLKKASESFAKKLWNGNYYDFDSSASRHHDSCHSDQLAGYWFLKACGLASDEQAFLQTHVNSALHSIFRLNVMPHHATVDPPGTMGAVNGARPDGTIDITSIQSEEFWTGVTYSVAAVMIHQGELEKAWQTAYGVYHTVYERYGLAFQTPEAYFKNHKYRSLGYMRPLAIWAIQHALQLEGVM